MNRPISRIQEEVLNIPRVIFTGLLTGLGLAAGIAIFSKITKKVKT